ncbi:hypothetical protein EDB84DRAFT_1681789 [Lactarius hengduanensis]|nr:hypothetical protein EDB84DRAFT_1681789 [Lactarius hengduanensis]
MSRFQRIRMLSLNLFDLCDSNIVLEKELEVGCRAPLDDISAQLYQFCSETMYFELGCCVKNSDEAKMYERRTEVEPKVDNKSDIGLAQNSKRVQVPACRSQSQHHPSILPANDLAVDPFCSVSSAASPASRIRDDGVLAQTLVVHVASVAMRDVPSAAAKGRKTKEHPQPVEEDVCRHEAEGKRFRPGFRVSAQQACTSTQAPPPHESNVTLSIPSLVPAAASATAAWAVAWTFFGFSNSNTSSSPLIRLRCTAMRDPSASARRESTHRGTRARQGRRVARRRRDRPTTRRKMTLRYFGRDGLGALLLIGTGTIKLR